MLVLSRRENETIVFPGIDTTIELLKVRGHVARIGIKAPSDVQILRGELADDGRYAVPATRAAEEAAIAEKSASTARHAITNQLNVLSVGMGLMRRQLEAGLVQEAKVTLHTVLERFEEMRPTAQGTGHSSDANQAARRALLVEDDANERQLLAGLLRTTGFEVDTANNGEEALNYLAERSRPDFVLMDMLMPRCDGPTAVRAIRHDAHLQGLKIFAVSGTSPNVLGIETGPSGIDRWFAKPLDTDQFVGALSRELAVTCRSA